MHQGPSPVRAARAGAPLLVVGATPNGFRRIGFVQGGSFEGDRLAGEVVSGNDWHTVRDDSYTERDVGLLLRTTTDSTRVVMTYTALRAGPLSVMARLSTEANRQTLATITSE